MTKKRGAVVTGVVLGSASAFIFTLNKCGTPQDQSPPPAVQPADSKGAKAGDDSKPEPPKTATVPKPPDPVPAPPPDTGLKFTSPDALVSALKDKIREGDYEGFLEIAGPDAVSPAIQPELKLLFNDPSLAPDPDNPIQEIAKFGKDSTRWLIKLRQKPGSIDPAVPAKTDDDCIDETRCEFETAADAGSEQNCDNENGEASGTGEREIYIDVISDGSGGFKVGKVSLPRKPGMKPAGPGSPPGEMPDALTVAHAFSNAIIDRDFDLARSLTDPERITDERVAALMIALEEGDFRLRQKQPLVVTFSKEDLTWVLTRVDASNNASEFAIEMSLQDQAGWQINGLTFSKLIASLAEGAGAGGVAYAPIVTDPQGGDSLVLYFEFDEEKLSQRTARQLEIVARILKKDRSRRIHINGHADAMGTDSYNEGLSNKRAAAVREGLIEYGASPEQVVTKAFGEAVPRRPNFNPDGTDNPGGRSQNRRAEVYLDF